MTDHLSPARRSKNMAAIKGRNTGPELAVRRMLHGMGYRFRLHRRDLPGKPDIVLPSRKLVVFVHGCFWHQHAAEQCKARPPKSNLGYWLPKLRRNVQRDEKHRRELAVLGWRTLTVWECEMKAPIELRERLRTNLMTAGHKHNDH
jgi:DNA mismatch endonuclease (patch repair protein)